MAKSSIINLSDTPTLPLLTFIETSESGEGLRIIERISAKRRVLGILLLDDKQGEVTDALVANHPNDVNEVTHDIFKKWLTTRGRRPTTWATFIAVLRDMCLTLLAQEIEKLAGIDAELVPTQSHQLTNNTHSDIDISLMKTQSQDIIDIGDVRAMIKELKLKFRALKKKIKQCIEDDDGIFVKDVADVLTSLSLDEDDHHKKFVASHVKEFAGAESNSELFLTMNSHWNYLDPSLLNHLVDEFELHSVKPETESYKSDLTLFRKKTPLELFIQTQRKINREIPSGFRKVVAKFKWPKKVMLEDVEQFRQDYATNYSLHDCAMMLIQVLSGSFVAIWIVPDAIVEKLKGNIPTEILSKHKVQRLTVDGTCVYTNQPDEYPGWNEPSDDENRRSPVESYYICDEVSSEEETVEDRSLAEPPPIISVAPTIQIGGHRLQQLQQPVPSSRRDSISSTESGVRSMHSIDSVETMSGRAEAKPFSSGSNVTIDSGVSEMESRDLRVEIFRNNRKPQYFSVHCFKKKISPFKMIRGSATSDGQFAYFTRYNFYSLYRYEYSTEKWQRLARCPYEDSGLAIINGELTTVGGWDGHFQTNKLMTLRPGGWIEEYPPMKTGRSSPALVTTSDGNYLFVIGGCGKVGVGGFLSGWSATVDLFQLKTREWYTVTDLPKCLYLPSATICGDQLNVIGWDANGFSCSDLPFSDQPITSPLLLSWTPLPPLPVKQSTAATLCGQLVLIGGHKNKPPVKSVHQLVDGQWMKIGSMAKGRWDCLAVNQSPDKLLIVGGYGAGGFGAMDSVEECIILYY